MKINDLYFLFSDVFFFFSGSKRYLKVIIFLSEKRGIGCNGLAMRSAGFQGIPLSVY
jgi:hypothetical protein